MHTMQAYILCLFIPTLIPQIEQERTDLSIELCRYLRAYILCKHLSTYICIYSSCTLSSVDEWRINQDVCTAQKRHPSNAKYEKPYTTPTKCSFINQVGRFDCQNRFGTGFSFSSELAKNIHNSRSLSLSYLCLVPNN